MKPTIWLHEQTQLNVFRRSVIHLVWWQKKQAGFSRDQSHQILQSGSPTKLCLFPFSCKLSLILNFIVLFQHTPEESFKKTKWQSDAAEVWGQTSASAAIVFLDFTLNIKRLLVFVDQSSAPERPGCSSHSSQLNSLNSYLAKAEPLIWAFYSPDCWMLASAHQLEGPL